MGRAVDIYYAYGSNMSSLRLRERAPGARPLGAARIAGWRVASNKPGADGTGKANLVADAAAEAWGVLYELHPEHWTLLDRLEPGYTRMEHTVIDLTGRAQTAQLYLWTEPTPELPMHGWYRDHLLVGAREHDFPQDYIQALEALWVR